MEMSKNVYIENKLFKLSLHFNSMIDILTNSLSQPKESMSTKEKKKIDQNFGTAVKNITEAMENLKLSIMFGKSNLKENSRSTSILFSTTIEKMNEKIKTRIPSLNMKNIEENPKLFNSAKMSPKSKKSLKTIKRFSHNLSYDFFNYVANSHSANNKSFDRKKSTLYLGNIKLHRTDFTLDSKNFLIQLFLAIYNSFCIKNCLNLIFAGDEGIADIVFNNQGNIEKIEKILETIQCEDILTLPFFEGKFIFTNKNKSTFFLYQGKNDVKKLGRYMHGKLRKK